MLICYSTLSIFIYYYYLFFFIIFFCYITSDVFINLKGRFMVFYYGNLWYSAEFVPSYGRLQKLLGRKEVTRR